MILIFGDSKDLQMTIWGDEFIAQLWGPQPQTRNLKLETSLRFGATRFFGEGLRASAKGDHHPLP